MVYRVQGYRVLGNGYCYCCPGTVTAVLALFTAVLALFTASLAPLLHPWLPYCIPGPLPHLLARYHTPWPVTTPLGPVTTSLGPLPPSLATIAALVSRRFRPIADVLSLRLLIRPLELNFERLNRPSRPKVSTIYTRMVKILSSQGGNPCHI